MRSTPIPARPMAYDPATSQLIQQAAAALARRDFATARNLAEQVLLRRPLDPNANQVLGLAALECGDASTAKRCLTAADQAAPGQPAIVNSLAVARQRLGEIDAARAGFARAGALGLIDGWRNLGNLEETALRFEASLNAYERALALSPRDPATNAALARAHERKHDLARAKSHALAALAADPGNANAALALAQTLLREKEFAAAEAAALPATRQDAAATNQALAWGLIGEARDKAGDAAAAHAAFSAANAILLRLHAPLLSASHLLYHPEGIAFMTALTATVEVSSWRAPAHPETPAPVFLVGFPRSGTTLLDQILSSHSRIVCIEEREHFANALAGVISDKVKLAAFASLADAEIAAARAEYWRRVKEERDVDGAIVIDKLPLNIVVLPLIRRVFPDARIVFALRDPRDVVLSCYQQRFGMNAAMAQFLDLASAGAYYDKMMGLFELCRERLDLTMHQVRYEDVVADLEGAARALAGFLELEFEPAMLDFRSTAMARDINTPSARQVIEPLYARSIGRWRRYREQLAPVLPMLAAWARRYGYPD